MQIEERIGKQLRRAREANGWTQEETGEHIGRWLGRPWSKQTVSAAEAGGRSFAAEDLLVMALLFEKQIGWFFYFGMDETEWEDVELPDGSTLGESLLMSAAGRPLKEAPGLAKQLRQLAKQVESLRRAEEKR